MKLYELEAAYMKLSEALEAGEDVSGYMDDLTGELETIADNYAKIIRNFETDIEGINAEEKRLKERRAVMEKGIERLKENLFNAMQLTGKRKFKTELFSFTIAKNGGALPVVVDVDCSDLPDEFVIVQEKPDLKALATLIEKDPETKLAHFAERGESLRIK